jgi:hypothetical protein
LPNCCYTEKKKPGGGGVNYKECKRQRQRKKEKRTERKQSKRDVTGKERVREKNLLKREASYIEEVLWRLI